MKTIIENIIKKRNPNFKFDEGISMYVLTGMIFDKFICFLRGLKLLLFLRNPKFILVGRKVKFFNIPQISFGKWVKLDDYVYLNALGKDKIILGNNTGIGAFSRIVISTSFNNLGNFIKIGDNVGIGEFAYLGGGGGLEIGEGCIVGQYFSCHPENHIFEDSQKPIRLQGVTRKGIKIGCNCWIGAKVTILDGVTIGDNCVIAAGAVVTKDMPADSVIGGVPAKVIKSRL